jgi:hypothetical protein
MKPKITWNSMAARPKRLHVLLKMFRCADVVAPVDEDAFSRTASEVLRRGVGTRWAASLEAAQVLTRVKPTTTRLVPPAPRLLGTLGITPEHSRAAETRCFGYCDPPLHIKSKPGLAWKNRPTKQLRLG